MTNPEYGIIKPAKPEFEPRELFVVPHKNKLLVTSRFGRGTYKSNQQEMNRNFSCLPQHPRISFRPASISESISAAAYDFENSAKPQILDSAWLQLGYIGKTSEGVFTNLPRDEQGKLITDESKLKSLLDNATKVEVGKAHIYLADNGLAFAEYDSFEQGVQENQAFAKGGLARVLEHSEKPAESLAKISSPESYKQGVNVWSFEPTKELTVRVAGLFSLRGSDVGQLFVDGNGWYDYSHGYAFGVLNQSAEGASQNLE